MTRAQADAGQQNGLTIGIPVYNERDRIARCIESALFQCERLIIADNCSTDGTSEICEEFASIYEHVSHIRHRENLGASSNFLHLIDGCSSDFFMFLGAHDFLDVKFSTSAIQVLHENFDIAGVCPWIKFFSDEDGGVSISYEGGSWSGGFSECASQRVEKLLLSKGDVANWSIYGVFRTAALRENMRPVFAKSCEYIILGRTLLNERIAPSDAIYFAWQRPASWSGPRSVERVLGHGDVDEKALRQQSRVEKYKILLAAFGEPGPLQRLALRFKAMVAFSLFKIGPRDWQYYALSLPVLMVRAASRPFNMRKRAR